VATLEMREKGGELESKEAMPGERRECEKENARKRMREMQVTRGHTIKPKLQTKLVVESCRRTPKFGFDRIAPTILRMCTCAIPIAVSCCARGTNGAGSSRTKARKSRNMQVGEPQS
jgi:hypothetical protein